jgi:hypothetical protein
MKKLIFRIAVLTATFFIGSGIFVFVFLPLNPLPEIAAPEFLPAPAKYEKYDRLETGFPGLSKKISEIKRGKSSYFPRQILGNDMSPKHSVAGWYSRHLQAMGEKSLLDISDAETEVYRFLWLRTADEPIFVRVERRRDEINLFTKELDGLGGFDPGKVLRSSEINLKREEFNDFLMRLEAADYWNLPTDNKQGGHDGAEWILEGVKNGRYHIVERWSPESGAYREACLYLLKLSGVDPDRLKDDLY